MDDRYKYVYKVGANTFTRGELGWSTLSIIKSIDIKRQGVDSLAVRKYLDSLFTHVQCVMEAGEKLGVDRNQLAMHDMSKLTYHELPAYAKHFHGGGDDIAFKHAWRHHLLHNPHHWQHWLVEPMDEKSEPMIMPKKYVKEMVADWLGASKAYTGSYGMTKWLTKNLLRINIHKATRNYLNHVLGSIGYRVDTRPITRVDGSLL